MKTQLFSVLATIAVALVSFGCAGDSNPFAPDDNPALAVQTASSKPVSNTYLWGLWDVTVDTETGEIEAAPARNAEYTWNVVAILNNKPTDIYPFFYYIDHQIEYTYYGIRVRLTHPFPGQPQFNAYDVRGILIGEGTGVMKYDPALLYPESDTCPFMLDYHNEWEPYYEGGGPDGHTRWFNATEFPYPGILGFTKGEFGSQNYSPSATLCPYRYFADGMGNDEDVLNFLMSNSDSRGVLSAGSVCERKYFIRNLNAIGNIRFQYAVSANWTAADIHPANAQEAVACGVDITPSLYWIESTDWGGHLIADITIWNWYENPSSIFVESTVLSNPYELDTALNPPISGGEHYSTWHVEIPADNITANEGNEMWVVCEYKNYSYYSSLTPPGGAPDAPLAAFFRYDLYVSPEYYLPPDAVLKVVNPLPAEDFTPAYLQFNATQSTDPNGDELVFMWDFDGDGIFDENPDDSYAGLPDYPIHAYFEDYSGDVGLKAVDPGGLFGTDYKNLEVIARQSKNIEVTNDDSPPADICMDHNNGDVLVYYPDSSLVRRYLREQWYQTFLEYDVQGGGKYVDISQNGYFFIGIAIGTENLSTWHYDSSGVLVNSFSHDYGSMSDMYIKDCVAMGNGPYYSNHHIPVCDCYNVSGYDVIYSICFPPLDYNFVYEYSAVQNPAPGPDKLYSPWIVACEPEGGSFIWHLQDQNNLYVSRWNVDHIYAGYYWGTGEQTDGPEGMYNPKDITADDVGYYYILDELSSGELACKIFHFEFDPSNPDKGPETIIHDLPCWDELQYTPGIGAARIDGGYVARNLAVLHATEIGGETHYFISTWKDQDLPL
jgi:hypothetical protein